jgi:hypothetical protein
MSGAEGSVVRAGQGARRGRHAVILGVGLLVLVLPLALLGVAGVALRRSVAMAAAPPTAVPVATLVPGIEVFATRDRLSPLLEHYLGASSGFASVMATSTQLPLLGEAHALTLLPSGARPGYPRDALLVRSGPDQTSWAVLLETGSGTQIITGRSPAGGRGEALEELDTWVDARLENRGACSSGPIAAAAPTSTMHFEDLWRIYACTSGVPQQYAPGLSSAGRRGTIPLDAPGSSNYWTSSATDGSRLGVIERKLPNGILVVALARGADERTTRLLFALIRR